MNKVSTEKKIEEGNRLIVFFDGAENGVIDIMDKPEKAIKYKDGYYPEWNLPKFHKDWNLLMPAIGKFNELWIAEMDSDMPQEKFKEFDKHRIDVDNAVCTYHLPEAFNVFTNAIKWYNEQNDKE